MHTRNFYKLSKIITLVLYFCSLASTFELAKKKSGAPSLLYNCSSTVSYQLTKITTLIHQAYDKFGKDYVNQAIFIKKGAEDDYAGGTWEVAITYNVSAKSLLEIQKYVLGHRPINMQKKICVFWYAFDERDPNVVYSVQKIALLVFPVFKISTQTRQSYSPSLYYDNILRIKNQTNKFCQDSRNLDDFSGNVKQMLDQIGAASFKVFVVASQYNGMSPGLVGDVYASKYYGFMPRYCKVNGTIVSIIFWVGN